MVWMLRGIWDCDPIPETGIRIFTIPISANSVHHICDIKMNKYEANWITTFPTWNANQL